MFRFKKWFPQGSIIWKLIIVNALVTGIMIWIAGGSIKDYACYLVDQFDTVGQQKKLAFNTTMQMYLAVTIFVALVITVLSHFVLVKKILKPIKQLGEAARTLANGCYPEHLQPQSMDEIGQLSADFQYLVDKLKRGEYMREKMLGDLAHELRTPLTNMIGYMEALSSGLLKGSPELFVSLHDETLRIARLVDQLHQLNVWEGKRHSENEFAPFSIDKLIETTLKAFELQIQNKEISLACHFVDHQIVGNADGIKQALVNLLKNAIEHDLGKWIRVEGKVAEECYQVSVTNQGRQIPAEHLVHIFERFYRVDPSRNRETGGTGVGLAIVKEIIEWHGGKVGIQSKNHIHTFWFSIPIQYEEGNPQ